MQILDATIRFRYGKQFYERDGKTMMEYGIGKTEDVTVLTRDDRKLGQDAKAIDWLHSIVLHFIVGYSYPRFFCAGRSMTFIFCCGLYWYLNNSLKREIKMYLSIISNMQKNIG